MRAFQIGLANPLMEVRAFLLEAIENPARQRDALARDFQRQIEQQGEIGLQVSVHPLLELLEFGAVQTAPSSLIGIGRIAEAVADHPLAAGQRRFDHFRQMFAARCEHQQGFGFKMHRLVQQQFPEFLAEFGTARLTGDMDDFSLVTQKRRQPLDMAAFAGAVDTLEGNEFSSHLLPFWYLLTALLCSSRVRENWLLPSPRATK